MARSFDGLRAMYPSASASADLNGLTVAAWINYSALRSGTRSNGIVNLTWGTPTVTGTDWLYLSLDDDKTPRLRWGYTTNDTDVVTATTPASINAGEWHLLAATANQRASPTIKFYVDGVQLGTSIAGTNMVGLPAASFLYVGGHARDYLVHTFSDQSYWQGSIGEVGIWSAALSAAQLLALTGGQPFGFIHTGQYASSPMVGFGSTELVDGQTYVLNANGTASDVGPGADYGAATMSQWLDPPRRAMEAIGL